MLPLHYESAERGAARAQAAEQVRLGEDARGEQRWKFWGPYLSERQWGTVREDYSLDGNAWDDLPHEHARSRAYRWGEDGLAGISDEQQRLCLALALWNGRDRILKERLFGLTNGEGSHGEDVKELYYYLDATPTHSYLKFLYKYPQREFPYRRLVEENRGRDRSRTEFELIDTGVFDDDRYFDVVVEYAKASPQDVLMLVRVHNRGPEDAPIHVLPQLWFRNTWSWSEDARRPELYAADSATIGVQSRIFGAYRLGCEGAPELLFSDNDTNVRRLYGVGGVNGYFKDALHDHLVGGDGAAVNPERIGTKAAAHYRLEVPSGGSVALRLRLDGGAPAGDPVRRLRRHLRPPPVRGRCVLRGPAGRDRRPGCPRRPAPGVRRDDLEQAVLLLRHPAVAAGRSDPATAASGAAPRPQQRVASPQ
jgi:hypothetical protein